jgi:hypothetical protein
MKSAFRAAATLALCVLCLPFIAAQESQNDAEAVPNDGSPILQSGSNESAFKAGEGMFAIQLGTTIPLFFNNPATGSVRPATNLYLGGNLSLRYMGFATSDIALGGEIGGSFASTVAGRTLFTVPLTFEAMWLPTRMPFEFPVGIGLGAAIVKLDEYTHIDPVVRPQVGVLYRSSPAWSFGLLLSYLWIPEFYTSSDYYGNFLTLNLSVFNHL